MSQQENDLSRLLYAGVGASKANEMLIGDTVRIANKIANAIPAEWVYNNAEGVKGRDLGDNYYVNSRYGIRELRWEPRNAKRLFAFTPEGTDIAMARQFAGYVAHGFIQRLCEKLEVYNAGAQNLLEALEEGERQLDARA